MAAAPAPFYDLHQALYEFAPGIMLTADIEAALAAQYLANGYTPLTQAQVLAITGPLPAYPTGLVRISDSNPASFDDWAIDTPDRAVFPGG